MGPGIDVAIPPIMVWPQSDLLTGLPIDFEALSNFCFECKAAEDKVPDPKWQTKHAANCQKNFEGSNGGAMEVACAERLWQVYRKAQTSVYNHSV